MRIAFISAAAAGVRYTAARAALAALYCAIGLATLSAAGRRGQPTASQRRYPARLLAAIDAYRVKHGVGRLNSSPTWMHSPTATARAWRRPVLANVGKAPLTDPAFAPIWRAIDARALPVLVHPTAPPGVAEMDMSRYQLTALIGVTFDTSLAIARMIYDGFFDRQRAKPNQATPSARSISALANPASRGRDTISPP